MHTPRLTRRHWLAGAALAGWSAAAWPRISTDGHGVAVLIRHAETDPGIGDPPGYRLDVCSSQRNLSATGRAQAGRLAASLAAQGLVATQVLSSRWCRCLDTARLGFGQVQAWPALDSFFDTPERGPAQTAELQQALLALPPAAVAVWVTHQVNISALSGRGTGFAEAVVLRARRRPDGSTDVLNLGSFTT